MKRSKKEALIKQSIDLYNEVYRFAFARVKDLEAAQDIAQSVMETVMCKIDTIKDESALKSWVMMITSNKIRDHFREEKKYREQNVIDIEDRAVIEEVGDIEADILHYLTDREAKRNIMTALMRMDEKYRKVIKMHVIDGDTFRSVAKKTGVNVSTIKTWYKRGITKLKGDYLILEKGGRQDDKES